MRHASADNWSDAVARNWSEPDFASAVAAARAGQGWAFERLYRWLAPQVTSFAVARDADDPEGLANEVFLRAFRYLDRFSGGSGAFRSWIFTIARNQLIDAHRAQARRPQLADATLPDGQVEAAETLALQSLGAQRVGRLLATLSDDQRDVILLRVVADLSLEQVAAVVDKPVTAVKALQRRGLRRLQSEVLAEVLTP
jgi:RNA polymerase sigma-70 factor (ECF subfamily)